MSHNIATFPWVFFFLFLIFHWLSSICCSLKIWMSYWDMLKEMIKDGFGTDLWQSDLWQALKLPLFFHIFFLKKIRFYRDIYYKRAISQTNLAYNSFIFRICKLIWMFSDIFKQEMMNNNYRNQNLIYISENRFCIF